MFKYHRDYRRKIHKSFLAQELLEVIAVGPPYLQMQNLRIIEGLQHPGIFGILWGLGTNPQRC